VAALGEGAPGAKSMCAVARNVALRVAEVMALITAPEVQIL
jgi:hypothetical protein